MGKRGQSQKKDNKPTKRRARAIKDDYVAERDMDDEIDSFHKQRDVIPLDINADVGDSDEDNEQPVFDMEDNDESDDDDDDDVEDTGLAARIVRQQRFLRATTGGVEDEMHDESEDEEEKHRGWGRGKEAYYNADNTDFELQSSDEELIAEEEKEVLKLQKEKAKFLSTEDYGLEDDDQDESDEEPTLEERLGKGKNKEKALPKKEAKEDADTIYEVKKDITALSREEQMDVVHSSAPELVGLLSELNDALNQLESKVSPLLSKVKERESLRKGGLHYLEVKKLLLLAYCQAITFYLLLKSEGQPVRDHPVIARLVEIKILLDKMKQLDDNLPSEIEDILSRSQGAEMVTKLVGENVAPIPVSSTGDVKASLTGVEVQEGAVPICEATDLHNLDSANKGLKHKQQDDARIGIQSKEMFKVKAALEEKFKQKGIFSVIKAKSDRDEIHRLHQTNGQLETLEDYKDDDTDMDRGSNGFSNGHASVLQSKKISLLVNSAKAKKPKVISGDDDLPKRDDIGERRRKYEVQVLAGAGIKSEDDLGDELGAVSEDENVNMEEDDVNMEEDGESEESEDEFYKQVKEQRAAKLATKAETYSRHSTVPTSTETLVDGKRLITYQMEKNRGLTRARKKLTKNPRKKYKLKHQKAVVRRKGQVRDVKKPTGPYGGETSGINAGISRSIRFNS